MTLDSGNGSARERREVEVRTHFDGRWVGGFEIADVREDRYLLRRRSDGTTLPVEFPAHDIRSRRQAPRSR
ncbi:MAG: hypothetical protein QOG50_2288 [Actinomycetota bacterium]|nr:hypothetical protein [Actinomycetota bacterium]